MSGEARGSRAKFHQDVAKLRPHLSSFAHVLTGSRDDADDLVQDTILRAIEKRRTFVPGTNLRGWLYTIMRNLHVSSIRAQQIRKGIMEGYMPRSVTLPNQEHTVQLKQALRAMNHIPPKQVTAVMGNAIGIQYDQIAAESGTPENTIKSRAKLARKALTRLMETTKQSP